MGDFVSGTYKYEDTGLEQCAYHLPGWNHIYNRDMELLNGALLKIQGLVDVEGDYLPDDGVLTWRSARSKWAVRTYD